MPDSPQPFRAFVALDLSEPLRKTIRRLQQDARACVDHPALRWVHPDLLHLTLLFYATVPVPLLPQLESALESACQGTGTLALRLAGTGAFPDLRSPRVLWVGITGDVGRLHTLQQRVTRASAPFAAPIDDRPFHPHLTIGRIRSPLDTPSLRNLRNALEAATPGESGVWTLEAAHLIRSELTPHGPKYTPLRRFPLA
ncbi:MAG TPA: RNA 2',3'-cyclic phosphodiesterase [Verrucomicrobiota bacterium]|nr:RNA 2',3'-cyclic phosphodiesterase [Verrucomicrobiota bacterium]HNU50881.1 RNA 2',3'-cyclic phosphodiesterase [Verrucomicrobiota bacterium]